MSTTPENPPHPLRLWREAHGMGQGQLAKMTGLSQGMISHIEHYNHYPSQAALELLVGVTGLPVEALMLPKQFLASHPGFTKRLPAPKPIPRGRPRKEPSGA